MHTQRTKQEKVFILSRVHFRCSTSARVLTTAGHAMLRAMKEIYPLNPDPLGLRAFWNFRVKKTKEGRAKCTHQLIESTTASILQVRWDTCPRSGALANEKNIIESKMWFEFVKSMNWLKREISLRPLIKVSLQLNRNIELFSSIEPTLARQQTFRPLQETQSYRKRIHEVS